MNLPQKEIISKTRSIIYGPYFLTVIVITAMTIVLGLIWGISEYYQYQKSIRDIRTNFISEYEQRLKGEYRNIIEFIEYKKEQEFLQVEEELRRQVQTAYVTASHFYSLLRHEATENEMKAHIVEVLRPIRWDTGKGYYFAFDISDAKIALLADQPQLEGKYGSNIIDGDGRYIFQDMSKLIVDRGAGFYRYKWSKPGHLDMIHNKISFVRYFKPFNWCVGAGVYEDDLKKRLQESILMRLRQLSFGDKGDVLVFSDTGYTLCDFDNQREGRNIYTLTGDEGFKIGESLKQISNQSESGGFLTYHE